MSDIAAPAARTAVRLPKPAPWSTRRTLQTCLGLVWLLDAALQFQPYMFSRGFVTQIIAPTTAGNPTLIAAPIAWSARIMAQHIVPANTAFAVIQLAIAVGLLFRRTTKAALAASIAWAVAVWWFGEGLGGVLAGASPLAGLPGAVILYALIAVLLWPTEAPSGPLGRRVPALAWLILWPAWLQVPGHTLATLTAGHGQAPAIALAALCVLTGAGIFAGRLTRPALILAVLLGLLIWTAEGFGALTTGQATDPNTGPLLILLAACFWPPRKRPRTIGGLNDGA